MLLAYIPGDPCAGLEFKPAEIIVLDLGSNRERQTVRFQRDFVLHKGSEEVQTLGSRIEVDSQASGRCVRGISITHAPNKILSASPADVMLKINVSCIDRLSLNNAIALGAVEINLQACICMRRKSVVPTPQCVSTGCGGRDGA